MVMVAVLAVGASTTGEVLVSMVVVMVIVCSGDADDCDDGEESGHDMLVMMGW